MHARQMQSPYGTGTGGILLQAFIEAVQAGDIWWHAMPFNAQLELMDKSLLQANIQLTHDLDAQLGLPPKITMSQVTHLRDPS